MILQEQLKTKLNKHLLIPWKNEKLESIRVAHRASSWWVAHAGQLCENPLDLLVNHPEARDTIPTVNT